MFRSHLAEVYCLLVFHGTLVQNSKLIILVYITTNDRVIVNSELENHHCPIWCMLAAQVFAWSDWGKPHALRSWEPENLTTRRRKTRNSTSPFSLGQNWLCDLIHFSIEPGAILIGLPQCGWMKGRAIGTTVGFNFLRNETWRGGSISLSFLTGPVMSVCWGCKLTKLFGFFCLQCTV